MTTAEPDALVVDRDSDDGFIRFGQPMIDGQATRSAFVSVPVSIAANADFTLRFLNVAADINGDGKFQSYSAGDRTQDEWVVVNLPVSLPPGSSEVLSSPFIVVDIAKFSEGFCARATLTTEPIEPALFDGVGGWDGSGPEGGFLRGETEDHCVQAQTFPWQETGTGTFIPPPVTPLPVVKLPVPKDPKKTPPNKPPPFIEPELKRKKIPPQDPPGKNPEDDKPPRRDAIFTEVLKRNNYIPRDQGVKISTAKQGPNECVPTATANSLKYLLDKRRKDKPSAPTVPVESQSAEQWRDFFKEKMSTDPVDGTNINPTDPGDKGFLHGKAAFNALYQAQTMTTGSGLETTFIDDPSWDSICECVSRGDDVEIVMYGYDPDTGIQDPLGHMVQVIGCNRMASGELELVINDSAVEAGESNNGLGSLTVPVTNGSPKQSGDSFGKGGLNIPHFPLPLDPPRVLRIEHLFCEKLIDS